MKCEEVANSIDTDKEVTDTEALLIVTEKMEEIVKAFDEVLGEGTCDKVFGKGVIPTPLPVIDFINQLEPIVTKYNQARQSKINAKYAPRRGGK